MNFEECKMLKINALIAVLVTSFLFFKIGHRIGHQTGAFLCLFLHLTENKNPHKSLFCRDLRKITKSG